MSENLMAGRKYFDANGKVRQPTTEELRAEAERELKRAAELEENTEAESRDFEKYNGAGWIGFDFDGTLAHSVTMQPIMGMVRLAKAHHDAGFEIRIVTARASHPKHKKLVKKWVEHVLGFHCMVTDRKDFNMLLLYDDRAVSVKEDDGHIFGFRLMSRPQLDDAGLHGVEEVVDQPKCIHGLLLMEVCDACVDMEADGNFASAPTGE